MKLIFAGVEPGFTPPTGWADAITELHQRDLVPVVRMGPPWEDRDLRQWRDPDWSSLAAAYAEGVASLPSDAPIWIELHNEPNLCYEWECDTGWLDHPTQAAEYAGFLVATAQALHAIGPHVRVLNAGLAPGGPVTCGCGTDEWTPGATSLDFIASMLAAEPDLASHLDGWAAHSYPASGEGYGFFVPFDQADIGLRWHERELDVLGVDLPVFLTETGWTTTHASEQEIADWTVSAYTQTWSDVHAILPFLLQDAAWDSFAWVGPDGQPRPVYEAVQALQ